MIYIILFLEFFKIGLFCFGGAFGMIPLIEETVLSHGWLTEERFYELIGVCESTPGPIAVNMATYIGSVQGGLPGSIAATCGVVIPSFVIILLIASVMKNLADTLWFKGFIKGVQPVVIALVLSTGVILLVKMIGFTGARADFDPIPVLIIAMLAVTCVLWKKIFKRKMPSVAIIIASAVFGVAICLVAERLQ